MAFIIVGLIAAVSSVHHKVKANEENKLLIAGGGSIPKIVPLFEGDFLNLVVMNTGQYPHFDIQVEVLDHGMIRAKRQHFDTIRKNYTMEDFFYGPILTIGVGTIGKEANTRLFRTRKVDAKDINLDFTFNITTRNNSYQQQMSLVREGKLWVETKPGGVFKETEYIFKLAADHNIARMAQIAGSVELGSSDVGNLRSTPSSR